MENDSTKIQTDESSPCNKREAMVTEDQLAIEIHKENLEKLAKMSEEEILEEKRKLEETLDPMIIQFLKNKKKFGKRSIEQDKQCSISGVSKTTEIDIEVSSDKKIKLSSNDNDSKMDCENDVVSTSITKEVTMDTGKSNDRKIKFPSNVNTKMDCEDNTINIPELSKEIFEESKQKGWLHMIPEPEKLKWMENLPEKRKNEPTPTEEYNARFDFNGN